MAPTSRPKRKRRKYTKQQRDEALAIYKEQGTAAASKQTGIPKSTIDNWRKADGIGTIRNKKTEQATKAIEIDAAAVRAEASNFAIQGARDAFQILQERIAAEGREMPIKDLGTVAGILADKNIALTRANEGTEQHNAVDAWLNHITGDA
jgi:transposase-like protein